MAIGSGLGGQLMIGVESAYNVQATPTVGVEITDETLDFKKMTKAGQGIRAGGIVTRSQRRVITGTNGSGDVSLDMATKGLGKLLRAAFGSGVSAQQGASAAFLQTFTLADLAGQSLTVQKGVPQLGGTVQAQTFTGCKVTDLELTCAVNDIVKGKVGIDACDMNLTTPLATFAGPGTAANVLSFIGGAITVDGAQVAGLGAVSVKVDNKLKVDRYYQGGAGKKSEPVRNDYAEISGALAADFIDTTLTTKFLNDANAALVLTYSTGVLIAPGFPETLTITVPGAKFEDASPNLKGAATSDLAGTFTGYDNGSAPPITLSLLTSDTAI